MRGKNMSLKFSVITVTYNCVDTIERTIKSVLSQNYPNIEYIIIDGASTDGTVEIIQKYEDFLAYFVSEPDEGLYYAMNKGIAHATGEIIGIINGDDEYIDGALERVVACYEENCSDVIYGNSLFENPITKRRKIECPHIEQMRYRMGVVHPSTFVKREVYQKYGVFNTKYRIAADYDLMLRFYNQNLKFTYINECFTVFMEGGISETKGALCAREAKNISLNYLQNVSNREALIQKIWEVYYLAELYFLQLNNKDKARDKMLTFLTNEIGQGGFTIFGTGMWGGICADLLSGSSVKIDFFLDNNEKKWGQKLLKYDIESPNKLKDFDGTILVAISDEWDSLENQIHNINENINVITIVELARKTI